MNEMQLKYEEELGRIIATNNCQNNILEELICFMILC